MTIEKVCAWLLTVFLSFYLTFFLLGCTCVVGIAVLNCAAGGVWVFMMPNEPRGWQQLIEQKPVPEKAVEEKAIP